MLRVAILDDYQQVALAMADWSRLGPDVEVVALPHHLGDVGTAASALAEFDVLVMMRERMPVPRALIERLPRLRYMVFTGSHNTVIDLAAAAERGIPISRTAMRASPSAAEITWALIMAWMRHIPQEHAAMRAGGWQTTVGMNLHGKTLGLLGLGTLGSVVARYGKAFDMNVIAWSPNLTPERAAAQGVTAVSREDLFRQADILSIHLKLGPRSTGVVGAAEFELMKPSALLVNTSRGPIVDEAAMLAALKQNSIGGAALDVFDQEPLPADHPLRKLDNVLLTPHLGYVTDESYKGFFASAVENIAAWRAGQPINLYEAGLRSA